MNAEPSRWPALMNSMSTPSTRRIGLLNAERLKLRERAERIRLAVQRQRRVVLRVVQPVRLARIFFLQARRIGQHELAQIGGARRAERHGRDTRRRPGAADTRCDRGGRASERPPTARTGRTGSGSQLRSRSSLSPWNSPQSIRILRPSASSRYFEPVTVRAAPRNVSFVIM